MGKTIKDNKFKYSSYKKRNKHNGHRDYDDEFSRKKKVSLKKKYFEIYQDAEEDSIEYIPLS